MGNELHQYDANDHSAIMVKFEQIRAIVTSAADPFEKARQKDFSNQYPYISQVQMNTRVIDSFFNVSGDESFAEFVRRDEPYVQWCSRLASQARDLIDRVEALDVETPSDHISRCSIDLNKALGDSTRLIVSYEALLQNTSIVDKAWIRRGLSQEMLAHSTIIENEDAARICALLEENVKSNPTENSRDIRLWFRAYRHYKGFLISDALRRVEQWALTTDDIEAYFYRYILNFISFRRGRTSDVTDVIQAINDCRARMAPNQRTFIYEWWVGVPSHWPINSTRALGEARPDANFDAIATKDAHFTGRINVIDRPQVGYIDFRGVRITFAPGRKFLRGHHEQKNVKFKLGFRYDGPYAWDPEFVTD